MNYADIKFPDVANGPGVRVSLFVSGCTHCCKGCFNAEAWDFSYGQEFTAAEEEKIMKLLSPSHVSGFSLLGGEPFEPQNQAGVVRLLERIKTAYPEKTVWCYTGYDFESDILTEKLGDPVITRRMIACIDFLVDGKFVESLKDLGLRFRGSSNQRIIDVKKSLESDTLVLWAGLDGEKKRS